MLLQVARVPTKKRKGGGGIQFEASNILCLQRKRGKKKEDGGKHRGREVKTIIIFNEGTRGEQKKKKKKKSELSDFEYRISVRV